MSDVIIIGAGGHAKVVADAVISKGDRVVGFLDDFKEGKVLGEYKVLGKTADAPKFKEKAEFVIGIGSGEVRRLIADQFDGIIRFKTVIHKKAYIATDVTVGEGTVVFAGAVLNPCAVIGKHCIVNTGAVAEHDTVIGDYSHISVNSALCGGATLGEYVFLGAGASVRQGIKICDKVTVGCGSAVVKDITEAGIYAGVPAGKIVKK